MSEKRKSDANMAAGHTAGPGYCANASLRGVSSSERIHCSLLTHYPSCKSTIDMIDGNVRMELLLFWLLVTCARIFVWIMCWNLITTRWMRFYLVFCLMKLCWKSMLDGLKKVKRLLWWNGSKSMETRLQLVYGKFMWEKCFFTSIFCLEFWIYFVRLGCGIHPLSATDMRNNIKAILIKFCGYSLSELQECRYDGLNGCDWDTEMRVGVG